MTQRLPTTERARRAGFTLMEVMLVMALLVILAAIAFPSLTAMIDDFKITAASDQVRARMALARVQAMNEGRPYRFAIMVNQGKFRLAPDSNEFWGGETAPSAQVVEDKLGAGIGLGQSTGIAAEDMNLPLPTAGADGGEWTKVATFLPDGTCPQDVTLVLQMKHTKPIYLKLRGLTGTVNVASPPANGGATP